MDAHDVIAKFNQSVAIGYKPSAELNSLVQKLTDLLSIDRISPAVAATNPGQLPVALPEDAGDRILSASNIHTLVDEMSMHALVEAIKPGVIRRLQGPLVSAIDQALNRDFDKRYGLAVALFNKQAAKVAPLARVVPEEIAANSKSTKDKELRARAHDLFDAFEELRECASAVRAIWSAQNDIAQFLGIQQFGDRWKEVSAALNIGGLSQELPLFSDEKVAIRLAAYGVDFAAPEKREDVPLRAAALPKKAGRMVIR